MLHFCQAILAIKIQFSKEKYNVNQQKKLHFVLKNYDCGENFDKLTKLLLKNCTSFGPQYSNIPLLQPQVQSFGSYNELIIECVLHSRAGNGISVSSFTQPQQLFTTKLFLLVKLFNTHQDKATELMEKCKSFLHRYL